MSDKSPVKENRAYWDETSDAYQEEHGAVLDGAPMAWGVWRIPETELEILGDVRNRDVLELGAGAAQWALALARSGARATGIDFSRKQLVHARRRDSGLVPLIQGDAESLPFRDAAFDIVFCDHGAMSFARPEHTIAESSRVLRAGGLLAFCMSSPVRDICWDPGTQAVVERLSVDYFGLRELRDEGDPSVCYQLPYGEWIRLFRRHGLLVEDLVELRPAPDDSTSYDGYVPLAWARRWPAEHIWKVRKSGG